MKKALLDAGASVKQLGISLIETDGYDVKSKIFSKKYRRLIWKDTGWYIIVDTDEKIIKKIEPGTSGLSFK